MVSRWSQELNVRRPCASPAGRQAAGRYYQVHRHREPPQGVRQHGADGGGRRGRQEIMATTFRVPVKRLILVTGTDYQDQLDEISYRIRALDPDLMSDEQFDEQVRRLRAERDRLKALPAKPDRWDEQLTGELYSDIYQALPASERGAWLTSHGLLYYLFGPGRQEDIQTPT